MRRVGLIALAFVACSSDPIAPDGGTPMPQDDASEIADVDSPDVRRFRPDIAFFAVHDGGAPQSCTETCDCPQGLGCIDNVCTTAGIGPIYCCSEPGCPVGAACLGPNDRPSQCPTAPDAGPDAGPRDIGAGAIGAGCESDLECNQAMGFSCWEQFDAPFLWGGYCTLDDCFPACPTGSECINFTGGAAVAGCMASCGRDEDCRADAYCLAVPGTMLRICYPDCRDDVFDCAPRNGAQFCSRTSGRCEATPMQTAGVRVGAACTDNTTCGPGQVCLSEIAWGTAGGMCSKVCSGLVEAMPCGAGETCQDFVGIGLCFQDCASGLCPDRANAICTSLDPAWLAPSCVPL